jgi:hypothetical protein
MKHLNLGRAKPLLAGRRLTRSAMLIGLAGATAGSLLLGAVSAQAATDPSGVGTDPTQGTLTFTDATTNLPVTSGPGSEKLKWNTSDACPSPTNSSAILFTFDPDTNTRDSTASLAGSGPGPYAGIQVDDTVANLFTHFTDGAANTFEVAVACSAGAGGSVQGQFVFYQYAYINYNPTANTFTITATNSGPAKTATTTTLTSQDLTTTTNPPGVATAGDQVQFTATVTDADNSTPAGSVLFQENGTTIGTGAVAVGALTGGGFGAQVTTTFATAGSSVGITATFTPSDTTDFAGSNASTSETVQVAGSITAQAPENLTVPVQGTFTITVDTQPIQLLVPNGQGSDALGDFGAQSPTSPSSASLGPAGVSVTDSRNNFPGWFVTGQTADFTGSSGTPTAGITIAGNQLGWTPNTGETWATSGPAEATIGSMVAPAGPGLGTAAATLASAPAGGGVGTFDASALLDLLIPNGTRAGNYSSTLTITAVTSAP